jgi:hypothetical protein
MDNAGLNDYAYAPDFDKVDALIHQRSWATDAMKLLDIVCLHDTATSSLSRFNLRRKYFHVQKFLERANFQWVRHTPEIANKETLSLSAFFDSLQKVNGVELPAEEVESLNTWLKQHAAQPKPTDEIWVRTLCSRAHFTVRCCSLRTTCWIKIERSL